ncbi:putative uncharacterized protein DDB_G0282499 [Panonychus citri]|uniref:putative uncharacterized protein DDB_G0282499 n=1 Tax=Panonychus citri TaxID=50023 RepID=UPI002307FD10|nr:putative uncharacterized protein DDB_G0282499 [Panonychus citri]
MMGGTWLDSEEKTKMARYSKYLDLVPIALLQEYGVDAILTAWPLRQISKKPRLHPYAVPWNDSQHKFISPPYLRNDSSTISVNGGAGGSGASSSSNNNSTSNGGNSVNFLTNATGLPIPSTSTNVPNLTLSLVNNNNSNNSNNVNNNIKVYRSRGILNECNYSNSFKKIDTLGNKGRVVTGIHGALIRPDGTRINNIQTLNSRTHLPSSPCYYPIPVFYNNSDGGPVGRIINNGQRYSAVFYPPVRVFKGNQTKSLEQDERMRREKLRKLIFNCTVDLSISSPLTCKLRERLSSILPKVPVTLSQGYEKFCTTSLRSQYSEYQPYHHNHLHPQFKPSRTLRSNTSLADEKISSSSSSTSSSSSSSCYVHHYTFSRKQRHNRWSQIEDKYSSSQKRYTEKRKYEEIEISSGSDNSNDSEIRLNPNLVNWSPTPVILSFPMIDFDEIAQAQREAMLQSQYELQNPPYVISFVPDESKKSVPSKNFSDLPPSLGYEIILEPINTLAQSTVSSSQVSVLQESSTLPGDTQVTLDVEKRIITSTINNTDDIKTEVKIIEKSTNEQSKKEVIPLRRSLRREQSSNKSDNSSVSNGTSRSSKRIESQRTNFNKTPSVCDITLSNVTDDNNTKPSFSKQILKTENVVVRHVSPSNDTDIKCKPPFRSTRRNEEKIISLEKTTINLRKVNQPLRQSKRSMDDEVMVIRAKDDLPRKKVETDDVVMIKVMKTSKKPRLRK